MKFFLALIGAVTAVQDVFDLPRELIQDVNKNSALVNIIADRAAFLRRSGLDAQLHALHPNESGAMIHATMGDALAAAAASEGVAVEDILCVKDFSSCPAGWSGTGGNCAAPAGYSGPCGAQINLAGLSPAEKASQAAECGAAFACK